MLPKDRQLVLSCTEGATALPLTLKGTCYTATCLDQRGPILTAVLQCGLMPKFDQIVSTFITGCLSPFAEIEGYLGHRQYL